VEGREKREKGKRHEGKRGPPNSSLLQEEKRKKRGGEKRKGGRGDGPACPRCLPFLSHLQPTPQPEEKRKKKKERKKRGERKRGGKPVDSHFLPVLAFPRPLGRKEKDPEWGGGEKKKRRKRKKKRGPPVSNRLLSFSFHIILSPGPEGEEVGNKRGREKGKRNTVPVISLIFLAWER